VPTLDIHGYQDVYGWDFISGDPRPFDDQNHGTEIAGLVAVIAPQAKLMPLKIFNPWGMTNSASIYAAFEYAVVHGADIIVCAWATIRQSDALEAGIRLAQQKSIVVVAAAGDRGIDFSHIPFYPAAYAAQYDNVIPIVAVDANDQRLSQPGLISSYSSKLAVFAAPGQSLQVAQPRNQTATETSSALAAAIAAGALARVAAVDESKDFHHWVQSLKDQSDAVPGLQGFVQGGRRIHLHE